MPSIFENMKEKSLKSAGVFLDKFMVNSMLNGLVFNTISHAEQKIKVVNDFLDTKKNRKNHHSNRIVDSITFHNFLFAEKTVIENRKTPGFDYSDFQYYIDNYKKIKEVEKSIKAQDIANSFNSYDKSVRDLYSIFKSELPEDQKKLMYNDTVSAVSFEVHKKNRPFLESILKKINTLEVNEANEFLKRLVPVIDSKGYSIAKYASEIGTPIFEINELNENTKEIKSSLKPSLK